MEVDVAQTADQPENEELPARGQPWLPLLVGAGIACFLLLIWSTVNGDQFTARFDSLTSTDIEQGRLDTPLPAPQGDRVFSQGFVPRHDGLNEIEITVLRYGEPTPEESAQLTIEVIDDHGQRLAAQSYPTASLAHNQILRLSFEPQPDSNGRKYQLRLSGSEDNEVSAWGYSMDVYAGGELQQLAAQIPDPTPLPALDLRFITRYQLAWPEALAGAARAVFYEGLLFALALLFLPLPGVLLLLGEHAYRARHNSGADDPRCQGWDPAAWWGAALALGVATWPVLWLWLTMFRGRWSGWLLALFLAAGWLVAAAYWWRERALRAKAKETTVPRPRIAAPWQWDHLLLLAILLIGFGVRLLAVRDTPVLPWVDASRHALITSVMASSGQTISDFAPYLPVTRFPYHYGFHTLSASLSLLSEWPLDRLLLYLGQLLNALVPLTLFSALWLMVRQRSAGYLAAFLVALAFFFPAYYATWGRLTQLTAVLILPLVIAFTWQLLRGEEAWIDRWWLLGILTAGLFLIHFRVLVYYLPFPAIALLINHFRRLRWLAASAILAFILVLSRLFTLLEDTDPVARMSRTIPGYNEFPVNYVTTGWERAFLVAAGVVVLAAVIAAILRRSWAILPLALAGWIAALFGVLSLDRLGVPVPSLFNLNSMYIIVFVPVAMLLSIAFGQFWLWLDEASRPVWWLGYGLTGLGLVILLVYGARRQVSILNPQTLLVETEDMIGLRWLDENLPQDAQIAVNSWQWLGETWAAADGGAWILPLTGRTVTTPPIDHIYNSDLFQQVRDFNQAATAVSDWSDPAQAQWLQEQGVSHIFVGKRGGFFDPAKLARNPDLTLLFAHDGVFIFSVEG